MKRALLSAHSGGMARNHPLLDTLEGFKNAVKLDVDYVEFDLQRTGDGEYVVFHDDWVKIKGQRVPLAELSAKELDGLVGTRVRYQEVLDLLAKYGKKAHLDYKFVSETAHNNSEIEALEIARDYLADDEYIVTTNYDSSIRLMRDHANENGYDPKLGLSLGRHRLCELSWGDKVKWRYSELFPEERVAASGANLLVVQYHLAMLRLLQWAHIKEIDVLLWTVNSPKRLQQFLADHRVWMVTTSNPHFALA